MRAYPYPVLSRKLCSYDYTFAPMESLAAFHPARCCNKGRQLITGVGPSARPHEVEAACQRSLCEWKTVRNSYSLLVCVSLTSSERVEFIGGIDLFSQSQPKPMVSTSHACPTHHWLPACHQMHFPVAKLKEKGTKEKIWLKLAITLSVMCCILLNK